MDEIRQILSEVLKLLATPEFQTQLEKSRQSSANDAVALLQSVRFLKQGDPIKIDTLTFVIENYSCLLS